jgi:hypothetical protein
VKSHLRALCITSSLAVALFSAATSAHADTVSGTAYCGISSPIGNGGQGSNYAIQAPTLATLSDAIATSGGQCASFTSSTINFNAGYTNSETSLAGFLNSTPGNLQTVSYIGNPTGSQSFNGTLLVLTGYTYLTTGQSIALSHDDGVNLYVTDSGNVTTLISPAGSQDQTDAGQLPFTFTGASGEYAFELIYTSNYEAPAELVSDISEAPEPSSFLLLGSGLLGAAGLIRRRVTR